MLFVIKNHVKVIVPQMHHQTPSKTVQENTIVKASISKQIAEQLRAAFCYVYRDRSFDTGH